MKFRAMTFRAIARKVIAVGALVSLMGCSTSDSTFPAATGLASSDPSAETLSAISLAPPGGKTRDVYAALYPYYAEYCAVSEINKKPGFGAAINGGYGGHAVLYLNGVCRVRDAGYPVIQLCDGRNAGAQGVGLSVNDHFKNANWVATEGRDFLFYGALKPTDRVTRAGYRRTQERAVAMGILDGVEFHKRFFDDMPAGTPKRDYMYEISISTDYAVNFGRDRYCARVPLSHDQMKRVVTYLNRLNEPYRRGEKEFHWGVLSNNCSHMTHNALAAAGIWNDVGIDQPVFIAAFNFPVPKNEFVNLALRTNDMPLDDPLAVYADDVARRDLMTYGRLPMRAGALVEVAPVMPKNDLYETQSRLIFYDPMGRYQRDFQAILGDSRYLDLRTNLTYFSALYRRIKADRKPLDWYLAEGHKIPGPGRDGFPAFYERYYQYVEREGAIVEQKLAALDHGLDPDRRVIVSATTDNMPAIAEQ